MGLFDKLLKEVGDKVPDLNLDELKKTVTDAAAAVKTEAEKAGIDLDSVKESFAAAKEEAVTAIKEEQAEKAAAEASGWWGPDMPAEENMYNSGLAPAAYFEKIFAEDFPACIVNKEAGWGGFDRSTIYRFYDGAAQKLVVELVPDNSSAVKLKEKCAKEGVPYLRFYKDHEGWWNARSYVVSRIEKALKG